MKTIKYFNNLFDNNDARYVSDAITGYLTDMDINPSSFSYEIHVTYEEEQT